MRKELEAIEKIEKYLKGQLSEADNKAFEKQLEEDAKLREELGLQKELQGGIGRVLLKQQIKSAYKKYKLYKALIKLAIIAAAALCVGLAILYFNYQNNSHDKNNFEQLNEQERNESTDAYQFLPSQEFKINSSKDTVIETEAGITFVIPAHCFLDENGEAAEGNIDLEIKEAMDASAILQAGLTTLSDNNLLETAGMFYINAKKNGSPVSIDPSNSIYAEVPSLGEKRGDMQLFDGKVNDKGMVNWVNPKPIENFLTPVDILSLNFYPPGYLDSLRSWGYNEKDKKFTDSLYYSFAYLFRNTSADTINEEASEYLNSIPYDIRAVQYSYGEAYHEPRGINPAKIKTIWNKTYANTLIATREFELRLRLIHQSCDQKLLDLYIQNQDKRLSYLDSMAAQQSNGDIRRSFLSFASRNEGRVKIDSDLMKKLGEYYDLKVKAYTQAAAKTEKEYWEKQRNLEQKAIQKKWKHENEDVQRESKNLKEEYEINLTEACRQLGIKKPAPLAGQVYGISIVTTGWKNIDAYVMEATVNRTTLDYTSEDGKKAVIRYLPMSITIKDAQSYDRLYVYLLPDKLNSFMRLNQNGDRFDEKLNELMSYKLVCLGYIGDDSYFFEMDPAEPKVYNSVELKSMDKKALTKKLKALNNKGQSMDMVKELDYWESEIQETKRQRAVDDKLILTAKVMKVILPCYEYEGVALLLEGQQLFNTHCRTCHYKDSRKLVGPGLAGITRRQTISQIKKWILNSAALIASGDPYAVKLYKEYNGLQMPMIPLSNDEIEAIIFYIDGETYAYK